MTTSVAGLRGTAAINGSNAMPNLNTPSGGTGLTSVASTGDLNVHPSTSSASMMDVNDCQYDIKTEFYTREGLWKLVLGSGEYSRQQIAANGGQYQSQPQLLQQQQQQQQQQSQQSNGGAATGAGINLYQPTTTSNDAVQVGMFKFSKKLIQLANEKLTTNKKICLNCYNRLKRDTQQQQQQQQAKLSQAKKSTAGNDSLNEHDDDDDVVFTKFALSSNSSSHYDVANNNEFNNRISCKYCSSSSNLIDYISALNALADLTDESFNDELPPSADKSSTETNNKKQAPQTTLDLIVFNYSKEIYTYEFNPIKKKNTKEPKNLIDKKIYKTYMSSCMDINIVASILNTKSLQLMLSRANSSSNLTQQQQQQQQSPSVITTATAPVGVSSLSSSSAFSNNKSSYVATTTTAAASVAASSSKLSSSQQQQQQQQRVNDSLNDTFNLTISPSSLSLIVAAGFSKGEIHVFDVFKKDASVFFNSSKLVDKTKVTCIKWLPNSVNLFLVGYTSGNLYLYDANYQSQATVAPTYSKFFQADSFSIFVNTCSAQNGATDSPSATAQQSSITGSSNSSSLANKNSTSSSTSTANGHVAGSTIAHNNASSLNQQQQKLVLSNVNQPVQIARNPLLKIKIGGSQSVSGSASSSTDVNTQAWSSNNSNFFNENNAVNDMAFSPCGNYLAVVSQDGYMRVFTFIYENNQQMQVQLRCSMKSYFGGLLCVCWSSDGKYVATGGEDDLITVFSFVEMRVVCRGRGHSSWINCVAFDPYTTLPSYSMPPASSSKKYTPDAAKYNAHESATEDTNANNNESDLEEFHNKQQLIERRLEQMELQKQHNKQKITGPKQRTISTLSDYNVGAMSNDVNEASTLTGASTNATNSVYYRLASVGQDNQLCFWDLTEDILKEKPASQLARSRLTSVLSNSTSQSQYQSPLQQQTQHQGQYQQPLLVMPQQTKASSTETPTGKSSHSTASTLVSTARNLFSKHSSEKASHQTKYTNEQNSTDGEADLASTSSRASSIGSGFFKKSKRNASSTNTSQNGSGSISSSELKSSNKSSNASSSKNSPIVLNSYKKSSNAFSSISTDSGVMIVDNSGINSLAAVADQSNHSSSVKTKSGQIQTVSSSSVILRNSNSATHHHQPFNLCPKLDEVPNIEPLICKRIANERLNSIVFREDCFIVTTQDGFVYTWSRPNKESSSKCLPHIYLPQMSNDAKVTTTL